MQGQGSPDATEHDRLTSGAPTPEEAFGRALRASREERGLSQEALARASGYTAVYISILERGKKSPSLGAVFRLAATLDILPSELVRRAEVQAGAPAERTQWGRRTKEA